jgi:uncharacterized protein
MNTLENIYKGLKKFEKENEAKIILAVESGSRAWGFASTDSDYDVRFVYKYPKQEYLNMRKLRDCFNWMDEENNIDYEGFDIYKFYDLLYKSNMNMMDWVANKMVYLSGLYDKKGLLQILENGFNRATYISHNYGLCSKNYHNYFEVPKEQEPTAKRYVYCIRALLSADYCSRTGNMAPLNFYELLDKSLLSEKEKGEILEMVDKKKKDREKRWYRNSVWDSWISSRLNGEHLTSGLEHDNEKYYTQLNRHLLKQFKHPPMNWGASLPNGV